MVKNYNGNFPKYILWELKKLCEVNLINEQTLTKSFKENGYVSFFVNLDMFGLPDEMTEIKTLNSEEEIQAYLKQDFEKRINCLLAKYMVDDPLLNEIANFIRKNNGVFPNDEEMQQLKVAALGKKATEHKDKTNTKEFLLKEIIELAEEMMEKERRETPNSIISHFEPYWDELKLQTDTMHFHILLDKESTPYYTYFCNIRMNNEDVTEAIRLSQNTYGCVKISHMLSVQVDTSLEKLITIHKEVIALALSRGVEFTSQIDYSTLVD